MKNTQQESTKMVVHIFSANVAVYREDNHAVLKGFFKGLASGDYQDGTRHCLYIDLSDHKITYSNVPNLDAPTDIHNGLLLIAENKHHKKLLNKKEVVKIKDDDIYNWGFGGWLDGMENKIASELLSTQITNGTRHG